MISNAEQLDHFIITDASFLSSSCAGFSRGGGSQSVGFSPCNPSWENLRRPRKPIILIFLTVFVYVHLYGLVLLPRKGRQTLSPGGDVHSSFLFIRERLSHTFDLHLRKPLEDFPFSLYVLSLEKKKAHRIVSLSSRYSLSSSRNGGISYYPCHFPHWEERKEVFDRKLMNRKKKENKLLIEFLCFLFVQLNNLSRKFIYIKD